MISFCGLLTLQVGAAILAAVFFTLAGVILAANVFDYHNSWGADVMFPFSLILMIVFVVGLVIAAVLMFSSSYSESRSNATLAVIVIAILICYWVILCMLSFLNNPDHVNGICIERRCPESFWIANLCYRRQWWISDEVGCWGWVPPPSNSTEKNRPKREERISESIVTVDPVFTPETKKEDYNKTIKHSRRANLLYNQRFVERVKDDRYDSKTGVLELPPSTRNITNNVLESKTDHLQDRATTLIAPTFIVQYAEDDPEKEKKKEEKPSRYIFGFPMIGAILLFILNLIFLIFSALVMCSWAQELDWADYYEEDPVVVVEDY